MIRPSLRKAQSEPGRRRGVKKLTVSLKKRKPKLPENFEETTWAKLKAAVDAVHAQRAVAYSREELYHAVENLCLHKKAENLFTRLRDACAKHIAVLVGRLDGQTLDVAAFLHLVQATWEEHCNQMVIIRSIFLVLDRTYVIQTAAVRSLWDMGLELFRERLTGNEALLGKLISGFLHMIQLERSGETVTRSLLSSLSRMLTQIRIYQLHFEEPFLEASAKFYRQEGARMIEGVAVAQYLHHVQQRLDQENDRLATYLDYSTRRPLIAGVESELIAAHAQKMIDKGFAPMMDAGRKDDLRLMYQLLSRVDGLGPLNEQFGAYAKGKGVEIVNDPEKDKTMVDSLLALKAQLDTMHHGAFASNDDFSRSLKAAFEFFINVRHNKPAEMIAKFVDKQLRSKKASSEADMEELLDRVMHLFRSINGKDVFEEFYKKDLAKRLLLNRSTSAELERSMLSKLKTECGSLFTSKLEGMFKDVGLSKELMTEFEASPHFKGADLPFEASVHVLTTTYWPAYPPAPLVLPDAMEKAQQAFSAFYNEKFTGRRLAWVHSLGHCVLRSFFKHGRKELDVSVFQACVLLLFNNVAEEGTLTVKEVEEQTGMAPEVVKLTLMSLACGRVRVLTKTPMSKTVKDGDVFGFNNKFKAKLVRLKINSIQLKESKKEQKETEQRVFKQRLYQIDAAVVRIMKTRKTLSHAVLMSELYAQLRFPVEPAKVKKRIASLLDREYLERADDAPGVYNYVA